MSRIITTTVYTLHELSSTAQEKARDWYHNGFTCEADTLGSCGYVYIAIYPTQL
ncbi:hypothetical protein JNE170426_02950 [Escherichia coli]|nr:hypothetical protein JNE170426_02950 [Escherichia coli]HAV6931296.1 hypothetical protein [Escherichia coli]